MEINLAKFGNTLVFRDRGKEAFAAFKPSLDSVAKDEKVVVSFDGVLTFSPSWGDEFISPLAEQFRENLVLKKSDNSSVEATLDILTKIRGIQFNFE